jgi:hypothetical protein
MARGGMSQCDGAQQCVRPEPGQSRVQGDGAQETMRLKVGRAQHGRAGGGYRWESGVPAEVDRLLQVRAGGEFHIQILSRCLTPRRQRGLVI